MPNLSKQNRQKQKAWATLQSLNQIKQKQTTKPYKKINKSKQNKKMVADYKVCLSYQNKTNQPKIIQKQNKTNQTWGQTAKFAYTLKKRKKK